MPSKSLFLPTWFKDEENWNLAFQSIPKTSRTLGTRIEVTDLRPTIAKQFTINASFELELTKLVSEQFALIIQKGFEVSINGKRVKPKQSRMVHVSLQGYTVGVAPFLFKGSINEVEIDLSVGFYRVPDSNELDHEDDDAGTFSSDESGWTVICNDRVVLSHDTTTLSGWGVSGVPSFHNQLVAIARKHMTSQMMRPNYPLRQPNVALISIANSTYVFATKCKKEQNFLRLTRTS